jgi:hypothetical protein
LLGKPSDGDRLLLLRTGINLFVESQSDILLAVAIFPEGFLEVL